MAFVEETLLPKGFDVRTNQKVYDDDGAPIAEFDVEIRGKVGSTEFAWLIECRDRPGAGPAPGQWIEQLQGRRQRFGFNKVTAVSTTGFSKGATDYAANVGIELREVESLTPEQFADWLVIRHFGFREQKAALDSAVLIPEESASQEQKSALKDALAGVLLSGDVLIASATGERATAIAAFASATSEGGQSDDIEPNGAEKHVSLVVEYSNDEDHFFVDTACGPVRIRKILFKGRLRVVEETVPIVQSREYRDAHSKQVISQVVSFEPRDFGGNRLALEMHHMSESGETRIIMRRVTDDT